MRFLIIDGYPRESRDQFDDVGMRLAGKLYADMLLQHLPDAEYDIIFSSDPGIVLPDERDLEAYDGLMWPGCNLTVYHTDDERVIKMIELCSRAYEKGVPQFGSCWGIQLAVFVAGGEIKPNPRGREMGVARKIHLTPEGQNHPMYQGKPTVFDGFISHDDEITELPEGALWLASNEFTRVQAVSVTYKRGIFWATQYHPEYDLHEIARLTVAREEKLTKQGFFRDHDDLVRHVERLEALAAEPLRKDLRWQLAIDDDLLSDSIRQCEFANWLKYNVLGGAHNNRDSE
jgi:GMP synthase (glutamine-hydrolysing)